MSWTRHKLATVVTWVAVTAWAMSYTVALATAGQPPEPFTAVMQLVVPPLLWVALLQIGSAAAATWRMSRDWWSRAGSRMSAMDPPGRVLAVAVAALPEDRREWGSAMTAELAEVRGRSARWRFALSSARATLLLPPAGGWPVLAFVAGAVVVSAVAVGPAVGTVVPGLKVFAVSFIAVVGAMVVLSVARSRRPRLTALAPAILVAGSVAASIAVTVVFLRREPSAAQYLSAAAWVYLAAVLAGCLWVAVAPARRLGAHRLAPHLGAAAAIAGAAWFLLTQRDATEPPAPLALLLGGLLASAPFAIFFVPSFVAARAGRSRRSGLQAAVWAVIVMMPLTYALWLPEALRRYAIDGRTLDGELMAPVGVALPEALVFCFGIFPLFGLTLGVVGAALGARRTACPDPAKARAHPTM